MNIGNLIDLSDLLSSLIGAFLGFLGAYWLLTQEQRKQANDQGKANLALFGHLIELLEHSLTEWEKLAKQFSEYSDQHATQIYQLHSRLYPNTISANALERLERHAVQTAMIEVLGPAQGRSDYWLLMRTADRVRSNVDRGTAMSEDLATALEPRTNEARNLGFELWALVNDEERQPLFPSSDIGTRLVTIRARTRAAFVAGRQSDIQIFLDEVAEPILLFNPDPWHREQIQPYRERAQRFNTAMMNRLEAIRTAVGPLQELVKQLQQDLKRLNALSSRLRNEYDLRN